MIMFEKPLRMTNYSYNLDILIVITSLCVKTQLSIKHSNLIHIHVFMEPKIGGFSYLRFCGLTSRETIVQVHDNINLNR